MNSSKERPDHNGGYWRIHLTHADLGSMVENPFSDIPFYVICAVGNMFLISFK